MPENVKPEEILKVLEQNPEKTIFSPLSPDGKGRVYLVKLKIKRRGRVEHVCELNEFNHPKKRTLCNRRTEARISARTVTMLTGHECKRCLQQAERLMTSFRTWRCLELR